MAKSIPKQNSGGSNLNNLSYTYQNLVGIKNFENTLTKQQSGRIWDQKGLNWNFGVIYKFG